MQNQHYTGGCTEQKGPEVFYGYCHDSGRMRMMDFGDFMTNLQKGYHNLYQNPASAASAYASAVAQPTARPATRGGCRCQQEDCGCKCCVRCADTVQYAYCGETRKIPVTFDNDSRRERQVSLQISDFASDAGRPVGWRTSLSEEGFTLGPCSRKTILITVAIDCNQDKTGRTKAAAAEAARNQAVIESCQVAYARLSADGCLIRPLIVAVAVLPDHCGARTIDCLCDGCC